jgi:osmoprotectant transport system substrate-binding protein
VTAALNAVSAKLDTDTLASLVTRVVIDKEDAATVAADFLKVNGLG